MNTSFQTCLALCAFQLAYDGRTGAIAYLDIYSEKPDGMLYPSFRDALIDQRNIEILF